MKYHIDLSKLVIHDKVVKRQKFYDNGRLFREEYYLNGIYYSKREYDKLAKSYYNIHSE